jgi:hypothetical protein
MSVFEMEKRSLRRLSWRDASHGWQPALYRLVTALAVVIWMLDMLFFRNDPSTSPSLSSSSSSYAVHRQTMARPNVMEYYAKNSSSSHDQGGGQQPRRVALLIAGQCPRFVYREQSGPLFDSTRTMHNDTEYLVDVYIALQCGEAVRAYIGTVDSPPYMKTLDIADIQEWYLNRGAASVTVRIVSSATMNEAFEDIALQATGTVRHLEGFNASDVPCWDAEVRKFYLRHLVFAMSLRKRRVSDAYVFVREDNFFLTRLNLDDVFFSKQKSPEVPYVIVDKHCEFGAYSDKMYVSNHLGAALLFSSTKAEFMSWMKRFLMVGLFLRRRDFWKPYQAEVYVQDTLNGAEVERIDLARVDTRYQRGVKCIPTLYFDCMPNTTQALAFEQGLVPCPIG